MNNNASIDALEHGGPLSVAVTPQHLAVPDGLKLVPVEPTPEIIAGAAIASWPTATLADIDLARQAAPLVLMQMDMAPGTTVDALAGMLATMAPAYRTMIAAAPAPPSAHIMVKDATAVDPCAEMRALCSACGGTGDVHSMDGEWRGQCTCVHAWQQRAEKAEARVKLLEASRQVLQSEGEHPAPCARDCEAPAFARQVRERDARIARLEAQLMRRRTPLSPEAHQAIAAARAAGQTIAATPAGLVFMNDGAEPGGGELDCPACGGSGHSGDVVDGSAP